MGVLPVPAVQQGEVQSLVVAVAGLLPEFRVVVSQEQRTVAIQGRDGERHLVEAGGVRRARRGSLRVDQRDLDQPTRFNGIEVGSVPDGYSLLPGVLHAYRVLASDLPAYVPPDGDDD